MTSRHKGSRRKKRNTPAKRLRADGLFASPIRIVILCLAVLLISVSSGILIGRMFGPEGRDARLAAEGEGMSGATRSGTTNGRPGTPLSSAHALAAKETEPARAAAAPPPARIPPHVAAQTVDLPALPFEERLPDTDANERTVHEEMLQRLRAQSAGMELSTESPAWKRYAALSPEPDGRPMIAIVIDDVGLNMQRVKDLNSLPALLTLSFLPYAPGLQEKVNLSRAAGNEVMLHLPMEPSNERVNPGPDALLTSLDDAELLRRIRSNLDRFTGYVGVNNHMGSRFTADERKMSLVMDEMAGRGLLFLDSKTTPRSVGYRLAVERGMPSAKRDYFIDHVIDEKTILAQLAKVEEGALRHGVAIAIGHPHPETISALRKWLPDAKRKGFLFVPVSAVTALTFKG